MRRTAGVGAIKQRNLAQSKYKDKGYEIAADQFEQMTKQMGTFRVHLEEFASKHKSDIRKDAEFRRHFQDMCASIGVDPLASNKGFWSSALGVGDYYYELGVQIVEVCMALRDTNGGLMMIEDVRQRVTQSRSHTRREDISIDDIQRAVRTLRKLGSGFTLIPLSAGDTYMVQSVPSELNMDHTSVLQLAQATSHVTVAQLMKDVKWEEERATRVVEYLVKEGLVWVDAPGGCGGGGGGDTSYWFPSLFAGARGTTSTTSPTSPTSATAHT